MRTIIGLVVLGGIVGGVFLVNEVTRTTDGKSVLHVAGDPEIKIETADPVRKRIIRTVAAPGEVEAFDEVDISGEVVAKILELPVEEGDHVKKGDLLCRLDDADYQARLTSAEARVARLQASLTQADADFDKADRDYKRQVQLSEADATSAIELADHQTNLIRMSAARDMRRQELIEAEASRQSAREDLEKTVIKAPIEGVVSQLFAEMGEVVITGTMNNPGTRIMVISDLSKMQVRCRVDETDAPRVKSGQIARIFLQGDSDQSIAGRVLRLGTKGTRPAGRDVVTFETLVLVDAPDERVKPGMSSNIEIEVEDRESALTIPSEAVVNRKRRDLPDELVKAFEQRDRESTGVTRRSAEFLQTVFRVVDGIARPCLVETGISDDRSVEVISGLSEGDVVVIGPYRSLDQLKDGTRVKKLEDEKKAEKKEGATAKAKSDGAQARAGQ